MRPEDVYELRWASDPRLAPDGGSAAVVETWVEAEENRYRSAIWLVPLDGSGPRRFTTGPKNDAAPRFSPDGTRLAFVSNRDTESMQLWVLPVHGGEPVRLTDLPEDVGDAVWSPDGTQLAFAARVRDEAYEEDDERKREPRRFTRIIYKLDNVGWVGDRRRHLFVVPADGSAPPRQLTDGDFEDGSPSWSPDGKRLVFAAGRHADWDIEPFADLYTVDAAGGEPVRLTAGDGSFASPAWSPDGSLVACLWERGGFDYPQHQQVAVVDAATGGRRVLSAGLDRHCAPHPPVRDPFWDGDAVVFTIEDRGNVHVYRVTPGDGSEPVLVVGGELRVSGLDAAGGRVVHTATTAVQPAELYAGEACLTGFSAAFRALAAPLGQERFTAVSADGSEVDAWLVRPAGLAAGARCPVLLNIHGGPFTQWGNAFFDENQVYASAGYAVLFANPRGSSGFTEAWGRAVRGPVDGGRGWGSVDYEDLTAVVDEALRRYDFLDGERLGVLGGSYGGYMTSWIVGHTDRFRAALSERAVNNMLSEFGSSDIGWFMKGYTGVFPFEDPEPYLRQSPTTYAANIRTPLLIMHSENDLRCNIEQGEHLFTILRLLRREVEFVRFPGESHELTRSGSPRHRVRRFEIVLDWFSRYLG